MKLLDRVRRFFFINYREDWKIVWQKPTVVFKDCSFEGSGASGPIMDWYRTQNIRDMQEHMKKMSWKQLNEMRRDIIINSSKYYDG